MLSVGTVVEEINLGGISLRVLIDGPTTGAAVTMFEMDVAPGGVMPAPHYHLGFDEVMRGVAGKLRVTVDGQTFDVGAGESLLIKAGEVHAFANPFDETAKLLCVLAPGVFGVQYFREIREVMAAGGPPDPKKMAEVMTRHGLVPVKPA
jgi:quercetin dioxygenase-like cupin family protein